MTHKKPEHNPLVRLAEGNTASLRLSINAKCAECMGCTAESINPGFRGMIRTCSSPGCPLFKVRPHQTP
jgi:hypothetical protein